ncbi:hypothetical protein POM88_020788 [Heracleum sosnowskyi]|uniref:Cytochrome P450 n=1 Tax=Heracleum sosnowskyi TaxID=360622 RepID=A0AAD8IEQ9_9APIA|nr:hypothetical protein POM88_020788 [Heracleum sosnowskyi]
MDPVVIIFVNILAFAIASVYLFRLSETFTNFIKLQALTSIYGTYRNDIYGSLVTLHLGSVPVLVVSSPKMAQQVMKTQDLIYCSRAQMTGTKKLSYNGLDMAFAPYSDHWRHVRKFCTLELFTQKKAQLCFRPVREQEVSRMIDRLSEAASASKDVNAYECFSNFTTSVISGVAFGKRYDEDMLGKQRFQRMLPELDAVSIAFFVSNFFPMFGWIDRLSGKRARLDRTFKEMDMFYQELIDEHLKPNRPESPTEDLAHRCHVENQRLLFLCSKNGYYESDSFRKGLMSYFSTVRYINFQLGYQPKKVFSQTLEPPKPLYAYKVFSCNFQKVTYFISNSLKGKKHACTSTNSRASSYIVTTHKHMHYSRYSCCFKCLQNIFNGGTGTSATALTSAMTELMRDQGVMKKAQEEIRRVIGKKDNVDEDDIQNLPYLRAVVKETMRLYPPAPLLLPRQTMETSIIGGDKDHMYMIKPKTLVYVIKHVGNWKRPGNLERSHGLCA